MKQAKTEYENEGVRRRIKTTRDIWNDKEYRKRQGAGEPADMVCLC